MLVERAFTEISKAAGSRSASPKVGKAQDYRDVFAYVLLGGPGAGKTTLFEQESHAPDACYVTARDFRTFGDSPEWHGKTLFIDALDETRTAAGDSRTPFDEIRRILNTLGKPRFRLSCRESDWLGASDRNRLGQVVPDGKVLVLRLNPLTETDILRLVAADERIPDAPEFIDWAKRFDMLPLMTNPQMLNLVLETSAQGRRPSTRAQTFEFACAALLKEHNEEHVLQHDQRRHTESELEAAGDVCAPLLLADKAGFDRRPAQAQDDYPSIDELSLANHDHLQNALHSKLFTTNEHRVTPRHRTLAEYLGAKRLDRLVTSEGLPGGRVLALLATQDGAIVSSLRGLAAWLATLNTGQLRQRLIGFDPLGIVLHGCVEEFSGPDKCTLFSALVLQAGKTPWFTTTGWDSHAFGAFAVPSMELEFRKILAKPATGPSPEAAAECVLESLRYGRPLPSMTNPLLTLIREDTWSPRLRCAAARIVLQQIGNREGGGRDGFTHGQLRSILDDIHHRRVSDPDDRITTILLTALYPETILPEDIFDYLHPQERRDFSSFPIFWRTTLVQRTPEQHLASLMDALVSRMDKLRPVLSEPIFHQVAPALLARTLHAQTADINRERLYDWLDTTVHEHGQSSINEQLDNELGIVAWFASRPTSYTDIIEIGIERIALDLQAPQWWRLLERLAPLQLPPRYGLWCFERSQGAQSRHVARYLLEEAARQIVNHGASEGLSLEMFEELTLARPQFAGWVENIFSCRIDSSPHQFSEEQVAYRRRQDEEMQEWRDAVRSYQGALNDGQAPPALLDNLAAVYMGRFTASEGDSPEQRLENALGDDAGLVGSVINALHGVLSRDDIPTAREVLQIHARQERHFLGRPFLVAMQALPLQDALNLDDVQLRRALTFYYVEHAGVEARWYVELVTHRPKLVADTLVAYAQQAFRRGEEVVSGMSSLASDSRFAAVGRESFIPLLNAFPTRARALQFGLLDSLLGAAIQCMPRETMCALVQHKLTMSSMTIAQRARWLTVGLLLAPQDHFAEVGAFVAENKSRARHISEFLWFDHEWPLPTLCLSPNAAALLIRLVGRISAPVPRATWVTHETRAKNLVMSLISELAGTPTLLSRQLLQELISEPELRAWMFELQRAQTHQQKGWREDQFRHASIRNVVRTLSNGAPASAADLAALITDHLIDLAHQIRHGSTNDYRQYWNEARGQPSRTPKVEEACRDALLSDLKQRVQTHGIDAIAEGRYADERRADIRVAYDGFDIPIEIKRSMHPDLWRAISDQLVRRYTRAQETDGYGIYLVFWFGTECVPRPPSGSRPQNAEELLQRLREQLRAEEARKISVCVIDVSLP